MAICSMILGGLVGFFAFLCAYLLLDVSFLTALGLYASVGGTFSISLLTLLLARGEISERVQRSRAPSRKCGRPETMTVQTQN